MNNIRILADKNIADVSQIFAPYGEVSLCHGSEINAELLIDVDVLLVRSTTSVDRHLLAGSKVSFVGSATIGTDHIDVNYLSSRNIHFANAPGCNANAVVQYVIAVLCSNVPGWRNKTVGIIGCGQVGGRLLKCLEALEVKCKVYDPFLDARKCSVLVGFPELMTADVVCVHTPLTQTGQFPTYHMIDKAALESMKPGVVLINAGRGAVVDNKALLEVLRKNASLRVILDVWEHEPHISLPLLAEVELGTPHIAGHSIEGKLRGTQMLLEAFCRWRNEAEPVFSDEAEALPLSNQGLPGEHEEGGSTLENAVLAAYNPGDDFQTMRHTLNNSATESGLCFDDLRRNYKQRWEFTHYEVSDVLDTRTRRDLKVLGFSLR
ncbi:MAG: 4-phosphoerythronate dehydrogenase [Porticoccaceae bacterium]|nr:4-phosphoerythronate dehydrogenase [Porticoccaceae bacterium]